nr:hypothetical protein [Bacillus glycinifermentans]
MDPGAIGNGMQEKKLP